jgi:hypothetical protein
LFQADGQKDGFHWLGMSHVTPGAGMHFGPVKKAIKGLLAFFAQSPPKWFQPFPFGFQNMTIRHNCSAHFPLPYHQGQLSGDFLPDFFTGSDYSSFDELSRKIHPGGRC